MLLNDLPGEARYASDDNEPIRPLKLRLVAEIPTSPSFNKPVPKPGYYMTLVIIPYIHPLHDLPMHGPQPAGKGLAPASNKVCQSPVSSTSFWTSELAAAT